MRVLMLISSYLPDIGGHEMFAHEIARRLVRDGHQVDVITGSLVDTVPGETQRARTGQDTMDGVDIYRVGRSHLMLSMLWQLGYLAQHRRYDLVHSIGEGPASQVATLGKALAHWPQLITIQGGALQRGFHRGARDWPSKTAIGLALRRAERIHAISHTLGRAASDLGARQVVIVPNGVDEALFRPLDRVALRQKHGISQQQKVMVVVSRLIPRKGVAYALQAAALAARDIANLHILIVGEGPQRPELEDLARQLRMDGRVRLLGWIDHSQLPQYLALADVFVSTPDFEGLGIVFIEALACGVPTIGSNVGGILDIIEDGRNGLLVTPGDVPALAAAIVRILEDEGLRKRFTQEGTDTVRVRFRWESVYQQIATIYQELLADKNRRQ